MPLRKARISKLLCKPAVVSPGFKQEKHACYFLVAFRTLFFIIMLLLLLLSFRSYFFTTISVTLSFKLNGVINIYIDQNYFFNYLKLQAVSDVTNHFPELSQYAKEQIYLIKEEIACLEKVSVKLETEMQQAMQTKGKYFY